MWETKLLKELAKLIVYRQRSSLFRALPEYEMYELIRYDRCDKFAQTVITPAANLIMFLSAREENGKWQLRGLFKALSSRLVLCDLIPLPTLLLIYSRLTFFLLSIRKIFSRKLFKAALLALSPTVSLNLWLRILLCRARETVLNSSNCIICDFTCIWYNIFLTFWFNRLFI